MSQATPDDPQADYGYIQTALRKKKPSSILSDHLGSTSYITDIRRPASHSDAYLYTVNCWWMSIVAPEDLPYKVQQQTVR